MAKHFEIAITDASLVHRRTGDTIAAEARLDGIYVIRTNVPKRAIAGALDDASTMHGDSRVDEVAAQCPQPRERALLVRSREPAGWHTHLPTIPRPPPPSRTARFG